MPPPGHPYGMVWDESDSEMVDMAQFRHSCRPDVLRLIIGFIG